MAARTFRKKKQQQSRVFFGIIFHVYTNVVNRETRGGTWWGCAAGTLEPFTYTTASSAEFCYPILELTPQIPLS